MSHYNRKIPLTRRTEYESNNKKDELDGIDTSYSDISIHENSKCSPQTVNGLDFIETGTNNAKSKASQCLICWCGKNCWKITESLDKEKFAHPFRGIDFLTTILSIFFYFYDVVSDIILAYKYYSLKRWVAFGFTAAFVFIPLIVINFKSLLWYKLDYTRERKGSGHTRCSIWFLRVIFTFPFMMGTVVRHVEYLYHGWKSRSVSVKREEERIHHYKQMLHEDTDAGMMRMLEAFLESAPQLILQMYIILTESSNLTDEGFLSSIIRPAAMFSSWIGVSWSLVAYHKALRASHNEQESGLSICGIVFYYMWRACEVGPRMIVLALFASQFQWYMLVVVGVHWIFMTIWLFLQKPNFYESFKDTIVFNIVIGWVLILCFQNVQEGHTRCRALLYYCVVYIENLVMLVLWLYFTSHKGDWYYIAAIVVVPSGMVLHIFIQLLYYKCCHPKKDDIVSCLNPIQDYNCYQSVCHSLSPEESTADTVTDKTVRV